MGGEGTGNEGRGKGREEKGGRKEKGERGRDIPGSAPGYHGKRIGIPMLWRHFP